MRKASHRAFTLIEILIVIAIIAILVSLSFPAFRQVQNSTKRKVAASEISLFSLKLNDFRLDYGFIPPATFIGGTPRESVQKPGVYEANPEADTYPQSSRLLFLALVGRTTFSDSESKGRVYLSPREKNVGSPTEGPGGDIFADERTTYEEQAFESGSYLLDPWGNAYGFYYDPDHPKFKSFNSPSSFDIWSTSGEIESGPKNRRRWVTSWKK